MTKPHPTEPACVATHLGPWACEPTRLQEAVARVKTGLWPRRAAASPGSATGTSYPVTPEGVAIIPIAGMMMKAPSKFDDTTSTAMTRRAVRDAAARSDVKSILLLIDSPGGHAEGTDDLARDVAAAAAEKPVEAFIEDLGASAAYWVASQARKVWVNPTGFVGSIGTYQVVYDESKAAELAGIKVHVVSTGPLKGGGVPGSEISKDMLEAIQTWVDDLNSHFLKAVQKGRGMTAAAAKSVATGDIWIASKAKENGLVDGVKSLDEVLAAMTSRAARGGSPRASRAIAALRIARAR